MERHMTKHLSDAELRERLYSEGRAIDKGLLRKAVEWVEAEAAKPPEDSLWCQATWLREFPCGTAYCVAGYVGQLLNPAYETSEVAPGPNGESAVHVSHFAHEALGLNYVQREALFCATNSAYDVRRIAEAIAGEPL